MPIEREVPPADAPSADAPSADASPTDASPTDAPPDAAATTPLLFGATFACPSCRLRFARRRACPACGATGPLALADPAGRAAFRAAGPPGHGRGAFAAGMPARLAVPAGLAVVFLAPGPLGYRLAAAGLLFFFGIVASAKASVARPARLPAPPPRRTRVHVAPTAEGAEGAEEIRGIARLGTITIASALSGTTCLAYGLFGATDDAAIADADGGDFDLELASGRRLMVSLEHAVLVADAPEALPAPHPVNDALAELLAQRAIAIAPGAALRLEERLLRDGDRVTVIATVLDGASVALSDGSRARVLAGTEDHPLAIRVG